MTSIEKRALPDRLTLPVEEAARLVALGYLDDAARARVRLADLDDAEALHDFRVAVRRLRSCLRAYRAFLKGSVAKKSRLSLRELAAATGTGRDTEVQLEWLRKQKLAVRHRPGIDWLIARLEQRRHDAYEEIRRHVSSEFARLEERLAKQLSVYRVRVRRDPSAAGPGFAQATAEILDGFAADLRAHLGEIHSSGDEEEAHEARISAKRLRYLLDPLRDEVPSCAAVVGKLKALQELLGDLHDAAVLGAELRPAVEEAAAERARQIHDRAMAERTAAPGPPHPSQPMPHDASPGLLALARSVRKRREDKFSQLEARWLAGRADAFFDEARALAEELAELGARDQPVERTFLLGASPERLSSVKSVEIEEGWLPGARIEERLRCVRSRAEERWHRLAVVAGCEVEEVASFDLVAAWWPLTAGRRLRYFRYRIRDGGQLWEIRRFDGKDLILAAVKITPGRKSKTPDAIPPAWLAPVVVREVTAEDAFLPSRLAGPVSPSGA